MQNTKYQYLDVSDQMKGLPQPPLELLAETAVPEIELPRPETITVAALDLRKAIEERASVRSYSRKLLTIEELSYLLWCTQGVKEVVQGTATFRTVPSAGARHCLETYLLINNVKNIKPGIYQHAALRHRIIEINTDRHIADKVTASCLGQNIIKTSAVTFIWTAVVYRMAWRYGERGYRYMHLDAGHVCQNLYLCAESIGCGVCAIAAFEDDEINQLLNLDGKDHFVIYIATVGKKQG
jgi:SagB-type dehydrogenase family enzyme